MIAYIFTFISALFAIAVGALGGYLSFNLIKDIRGDSVSQIVGWVLLIISLAYIAHPAISLTLIKSDRIGWSYFYNALSVLISIVFLTILISSIEVAARP
jgi:hypothetical protein